MKNSNGKIELETVKLERVPIESNHKEKNLNLCKIIKKIIFMLCIYLFSYIFYFIYNLSKNKEKFEYINPHFINGKTERNLSSIEREYLYDINFYTSNRMYASKDNNGNGLSYNILFNTHTLEKGLSHFDLRPFGEKKIKTIIDLLKKQLNFNNYERLFSFVNGINSLREYKKVYKEHKWTYKQEYKEVSDFLKDYENIKEQRAGAYILTKEELKNDYDIDYYKFIKSRHSTRNYKNIPLKMEDIKKAIEMAKFSPSACNRQYIKVHYYPKGKMRENVIDYSIGKGGFYLDGVNTFIITFDTNALHDAGERNQGYFNAGLFSTNFVNALHSLGIGTCFIEFNNSVEEEQKLKKLNEIPYNERIAVILFAGYYDEKSFFCVSPRKDSEEFFKLHE